MNISAAIEHLQEIGRVCVTDVKDTNKLQESLKKRGYNTKFISTDRDYLTLVDTDLNDILSLQEAAELWGLDDSTLRHAIAKGRFLEGEYRKTGRNYIITKKAMKRVYGNG